MQNTPQKTLLFVCGTRPEIIKLAPVIHAVEADPAVRAEVCLTAQHRQLTDQFLPFFDLRPCVDLDLMVANQPLAELTSQMILRCSAVYRKHRPDLVFVQGDTATAFAAALAASFQQIPVAHVEAGLRSHCLDSPFPEEINRVLIGRLAQLHFAPTPTARENLHQEGVRERVFVVGNTVVDALRFGLRSLARTGRPAGLAALNGDLHRPLVLITLHRRESWGEPLQNVCRALAEVARSYPEVEFLYPIHPNPLVREPARQLLGGLANIRLLDPLGYPEFLWLLCRSALVLTDSGGVVEEAATLGIPTLVAREETERAEAINAGEAILVGFDRKRIVAALRTRLDAAVRTGPIAPRDGENTRPVFGDGHAATRILHLTKCHLGLTHPVPVPAQENDFICSGMDNVPTKICCFRFDVDTHACVLRGMPRLMDLAESFDAQFTFFVNPGRAFSQIISLRKLLVRLLDKKPSGKKRKGHFSAAAKLGLANSLTAMVLNPRVAASAPPILRVAGQDGHEIALHGGTNHATWERNAHTWSKEQLSIELAAGLATLQACGVGQPVSFASPGWNSPAHLAELLPELGLRILADSYDADALVPRRTDPGFVTVPTNITAPGSTAGYLEGMRAHGVGDAEIRADFRRQLASKEHFAGVYEHPFYAALHEVPLLSDLLRIAADEGFAVRTIRDAAASIPPRTDHQAAVALAS